MASSRKMSPVVQLKLIDTVAGLKIPKTDIGVAFLSSVYLEFKFGSIVALYGIGAKFSLGAGTAIVSSVATDWFTIAHSNEIQPRILRLAGLLADVELTGVLIGGFGNVDIKVTVYDEIGSEMISIANVNRPAQGILMGDSKLRGKLVALGSNLPRSNLPQSRTATATR